MMQQRLNVLPPLVERRKDYLDHTDTEIEIFAEPAIGQRRVDQRVEAFDAGVRILGDPYLLSASANVKGSVLLTPLTEGPKTYARDAGRIVELH